MEKDEVLYTGMVLSPRCKSIYLIVQKKINSETNCTEKNHFVLSSPFFSDPILADPILSYFLCFLTLSDLILPSVLSYPILSFSYLIFFLCYLILSVLIPLSLYFCVALPFLILFCLTLYYLVCYLI